MTNSENSTQQTSKPSSASQPSRIKKQQQRYVAIAVMAVALIGWVGYTVLSGHSSDDSHSSRAKTTHVDIANPLTQVNESQVWVEQTQNALAQTQKTTSELQQQLQLLNQQKIQQTAASQSQSEAMQTLQLQVKSLQEKLNQEKSNAIGASSNPNTPIQLPAKPIFQPLPGVSDDTLTLMPRPPAQAAVIRPSKTPESYVPSGTFVKAVMLGGADASAGVNSQSNPTPVLFRLLDDGVLPNHHHSHLKDCVATAAAIGDISSERGLMRLERLSCVSPNHHEVIELPVEGTVFGPEGKNGVRGLPLWREGALLKRAFVAGALSGFSQGIASQYTTTSVSPTGTVNSINNADIFKYGAASGVSNAMDKLADYNIRRADQYHPVIQLSAGTLVDIVFLKGFYLDGQKHDNEKETILPPFESSIPSVNSATLFPVTQTDNAIATTTMTSPASSPSTALPLTTTQINVLKTQAGPNASIFK